MRASSFAVARPAEYDRSPGTIRNSYAAGDVAPHATTTRWTYTVSSGKRSRILVGQVMMARQTAGGVAGRTAMRVLVTPSGGSAGAAMHIADYTNAVNSPNVVPYSGGGFLNPGDVASGDTEDTSTGGLVTYSTSMFNTEFDT